MRRSTKDMAVRIACVRAIYRGPNERDLAPVTGLPVRVKTQFAVL
jgi:hypothetical protein